MRWSTESRVPFLTLPLAHLALSLPESYLLSPTGETKKILRVSLAGIVPDSVLHRRDKLGFETPEQDWLQALGAQSAEWLDGLTHMAGLNFDAARALLLECINRQRPYSSQTWRLMNAGRWVQIFGY